VEKHRHIVSNYQLNDKERQLRHIMARQILQQCLECSAWSLSTTCPICGGKAQAAAPIKWSPEDHRASIRRKMYDVNSKKWTKNLPELDSLDEMKANSKKPLEEE